MNDKPLQNLVSARGKGEAVKKAKHGKDIYTYVAISISSDLAVLKIYSIVLTFMLPNFGNMTNDQRQIKYLILVFSNKIIVVLCVSLYFVIFCLF